MDYDVVLKAIREATDLRKLLDSVETQIADKDAQIANDRKEIERRKGLEGRIEKLVTEREDLAKGLEKHQAELNKRLAKLEEANVTLPFDEKPKPFVHS